MAGPLETVHISRLSRVMRGDEEGYLRRPLIQKVQPVEPPRITPWWQGNVGAPASITPGWHEGVGAVDFEYGASMQPRNNPKFSDTWVIGATAGANRVIPQGIDYSRTPCCVPGGMGDASAPVAGALLFAVVGVPLLVFGVGVVEDVLVQVFRGDNPPRSGSFF